MTIRQWQAELRRLIDKLGGGELQQTRSGHYRIRLAVGGPIVHCGGTVSDHRAIRNIRAELRRAAAQARPR